MAFLQKLITLQADTEQQILWCPLFPAKINRRHVLYTRYETAKHGTKPSYVVNNTGKTALSTYVDSHHHHLHRALY